jgi:NAD(P)-dependent dehydrogenase (short-subunit alcohol dehydrogenase family)
MRNRRVLVVGSGQTDYAFPDQPVGIGRAIALLIAVEGGKVAVADLDRVGAERTRDMITTNGGEAQAFVADVRAPHEVEAMVSDARDWLGGLDGAVYNVGIGGPAGLAASTAEAWDNAMSVNLRGAMLTARSALPVMEDGSSIVLISSIGGLRAGGPLVAYAASKSGMLLLGDHLAAEGAGRRIRANSILPGGIDTGMAREQDGQTAKERGRTVGLGRAGTAWDVAYATVFLLSDESAFITGQHISVDGGRSAKL